MPDHPQPCGFVADLPPRTASGHVFDFANPDSCTWDDEAQTLCSTCARFASAESEVDAFHAFLATEEAEDVYDLFGRAWARAYTALAMPLPEVHELPPLARWPVVVERSA